jgi:hypothetical protein
MPPAKTESHSYNNPNVPSPRRGGGAAFCGTVLLDAAHSGPSGGNGAGASANVVAAVLLVDDDDDDDVSVLVCKKQTAAKAQPRISGPLATTVRTALVTCCATISGLCSSTSCTKLSTSGVDIIANGPS